MGKQFIAIFICMYVGAGSSLVFSQELKRFNISFKAMGTRFDIILVHENKQIADSALHFAKKETFRLESLISSWDPHSQTSEINRMAGKQAVVVSPELFELIVEAVEISRLTRGAFDISFVASHQLYVFDRKEHPLPPRKKVRKSIEQVGFRMITLDHEKQTVFLGKQNMSIGFGAIGKGFAADKVKEGLLAMGIQHGLVNAGGDVVAWGVNDSGNPWRLGISDPTKGEALIGSLEVGNAALVTSGNAEKFFTYKGRRYAHILDPRTGKPTLGLKSVTVLTKKGSQADALATAIFVMGKRKGFRLVKKMPDVEALWITDSNEILFSSGFPFTAIPSSSP